DRRTRARREVALIAAGGLAPRVRHRQRSASQVGRCRDDASATIQELDVDAGFDELAECGLELARRDVLGLERAANAGADFTADLIGAYRESLIDAIGQALLQ